MLQPSPFSTSIDTSTSEADSAIINVGGRWPVLNFEVAPASQNLATFKVQIKVHPDGDWHDLGLDFTTEGNTMRWASASTLATTVAGQKAAARVIIGPCHQIKFSATCAASTGTCAVIGTVHG